MSFSFNHAVSTSALQKSVEPRSVITLVLIENSRALERLWPDLRDHYLRSALSKLEARYPGVPHISYVLETLVPGDQFTGPGVARQCDSLDTCLEDLQFNYSPLNVLSSSDIWRAIEFLCSASIQGPSTVRNILVIAASSPVEGTNAKQHTSTVPFYNSWFGLAQRLTETNIQWHMILNATQDMRRLNMLFDETTMLQRNVEEPLWLPAESDRFLVRFSSKPQVITPSLFAQESFKNPPSTSYHALDSSFPDDHPDSCSPPHLPPEPSAEAPSLVAQLQQVHGLTKKKVYGTKPVRKPFFRDERVTETSRRSTLLARSVPVDMDMTRAPGGRVVSHSVIDRSARVRHTSSAGGRMHGYHQPAPHWSPMPMASPIPSNLPSVGSSSAAPTNLDSYISSPFDASPPSNVSNTPWAPFSGTSPPSSHLPGSTPAFAPLPTLPFNHTPGSPDNSPPPYLRDRAVPEISPSGVLFDPPSFYDHGLGTQSSNHECVFPGHGSGILSSAASPSQPNSDARLASQSGHSSTESVCSPTEQISSYNTNGWSQASYGPTDSVYGSPNSSGTSSLKGWAG
ncbi:uncharacterized protein EV420DRAFT_633621 [Desarmillaria tabescens]|uniref:Uncharacterized protein n=1 Tax=Armillaria tabescens TaxID=1929756 RepID=A0AA39K239_ARMTA|nr:uncharacterized protein EV420DRAFT_633621 [Desarmillaria tabescens]KAK0452978.1 hypothetical protein EV420DRAFT_633621 [Desarmillaria tabescens]